MLLRMTFRTNPLRVCEPHLGGSAWHRGQVPQSNLNIPKPALFFNPSTWLKDLQLPPVWAHYAARFGDSTNVATWRGIDAFTWMKHNGQWRIVALAYIDEPDSKRGAP